MRSVRRHIRSVRRHMTRSDTRLITGPVSPPSSTECTSAAPLACCYAALCTEPTSEHYLKLFRGFHAGRVELYTFSQASYTLRQASYRFSQASYTFSQASHDTFRHASHNRSSQSPSPVPNVLPRRSLPVLTLFYARSQVRNMT